ncbi:5-formyltetrahydrofolate cyclo-ligase [Aequorivita sp. H23M31]|uniref:5-formyltetrahydrofolate cyclo-ligase n=1 Tax=Aequorivita ciconiae TaxID=2494375 RepID=A0A410G5M8_9FLAO|nr:5-formyltetrahydrofolate cyclo-ligase [Aequorivita sp. H23M31]QAA82563.1 5-formyltetrahydrofolate cyclo-ligase [Aequorivita sp. H23M31]
MSHKSDLRIKYKKLREDLSESSVEDMSLQIANQALKLPIWNGTYYHIFLPISHKKEVDTSFLMHILQGKEKSIVVSKADFSTNEMKHILLQDNTPLKVSDYGIPEPVSGIEISPEILDVVFVPLLAYDLNGHRIGYGKGFYDRFLKKCRKDTVFIGLSFFEPEPKIFFEATDIPLDYCITPEKTFDFKNNHLSL